MRIVQIAILAFALAIPYVCNGSHITLEMQATSRFKGGKCRIDAKITNRGDETAYRIRNEAILGQTKQQSQLHDTLEPGQSMTMSIDLGTAPDVPGTYTVVLLTHYTDQNNYPFTALSSIPLLTTDPIEKETPVRVRLSSTELASRGHIPIAIESRSRSNITVRLSLILPPELSVSEPPVVPLAPMSTTNLTIRIDNRWARPGSCYSVFAVIDYNLDGQHISSTSSAELKITHPYRIRAISSKWWIALAIVLAVCTIIVQIAKPEPKGRIRSILALTRRCYSSIVLLSLAIFTLYHIPPAYLLMDTIATGGDTPAHNYLASHLAQQLFHHGRIVSWADGWWCGFPMFQYYFCLPYILIVVLDIFIPFNIAFKIVSVIGILSLPTCAYIAARTARLPKPMPILAAIAMAPFLFIRSHTMWGASIYSTLAGMIANSLGFSIMLLFVACVYRDAMDGKMRIRTVLLTIALLASHFFTSVVAILSISVIPLLFGPKRIFRTGLILASECAMGVALMAWWLTPLIVKQGYSMDFGINWDVNLLKTLPPAALIALVSLSAAGAILSFRRPYRFLVVSVWMAMFSVFLFYFGYSISPVFVNVRLWPFIFYGLLNLAAAAIGALLAKLKAQELGVSSILIIALVVLIDQPNHVRAWSEWNFKGMEKKPYWPAFETLALSLDGTPGRLANDLHEDNNSLGSTRVFECVPHLISKPILEGGIVNSAIGSMFSYYIQSETSRSCAGFPTIVKPTSFNFENATKHLELFNVKHFIARWPETQKALRASPHWEFLNESHGWELYELTTHDGSFIHVPGNKPIGVQLNDRQRRGKSWKLAGLQWLYNIQFIDQPFVFLDKKDGIPSEIEKVISEFEFFSSITNLHPTIGQHINKSSSLISEEAVDNGLIRFKTRAVGKPHIIKCTYFPNWKVRGAKQVFMVTPCFMLVFPEKETVELYFARTLSDYAGMAVSIIGLLFAGAYYGRGIWR
ncbi:MAG: hypothetical protein JXN60_00245 [Lentisphaerae bacterium]|nr:hypothetical protein [Lentisphaerota bacterium]